MGKHLINKMKAEPKQKLGKSLKKSTSVSRRKNKKMNVLPLNPMVFYPRFQHITEQIFEKLDSKSLKNCRKVSKSWQECIDNQNILWNKIVKKKGGNKTFQLACKNGHSKMVEMLIKKPAKFNIDLNAKHEEGKTAFHFAWENMLN